MGPELLPGVEDGRGAVSTGVIRKETVGAEAGAHPIKRSEKKNEINRIFINDQAIVTLPTFILFQIGELRDYIFYPAESKYFGRARGGQFAR
jgi:hypothetical protein